MRSFKDKEGLEWVISITTDAIKRVRDLLKVDLLEIIEGKKLTERLVSDPILLVDVVYVICQPQAQQRNITDETFGRSMGGDAIANATDAFMEELADFFRNLRRPAVAKALEKVREAETLTNQRILEKVEAIDVSSLLATLGDSSGSKPASAESTPDPARYAKSA